MPPCIDCYTLIERRDTQAALDFLDAFLPHRSSLYEEHHLPHDAEGAEVVLNTDEEAMDYLAERPDRRYTIYTVNEAAAEPNYAMVGYTRDGKMVLGLSCEEEHPALAAEYLSRLKAFAGTDHGFCGAEVAPPETAAEYEEAVAAFGDGAWLRDAS